MRLEKLDLYFTKYCYKIVNYITILPLVRYLHIPLHLDTYLLGYLATWLIRYLTIGLLG